MESRTCPAYVVDTEDVLSQPILVVDPQNPAAMAFHALHGGPGITLPGQTAGPGPAARDDSVHQPHTVFHSTDGGHEWFDNPYYSPFYDERTSATNVSDGPRAWGLDNALTADRHGNLFVGSLYAHRANSRAPLEYAVALWKSGDPTRPFNSAHNLVVKSIPADAAASDLHLGFVPELDRAFALVLERSNEKTPVVRIWHAGPSDNPLRWETAAEDRALTCQAISNPIVVEGLVFLACPTPKPSSTSTASIQVHRLNPADGWNATKIADVPMEASNNLVLASATTWGRGMMALASGGVTGGKPFLLYSYGVLGEKWRPVVNYGAQVTAAAANPLGPQTQQGAILRAAHVTAMAYSQRSSAFHVIYMERWDTSTTSSAAREFTKTYSVIHAGGQFLGTADIAYGGQGAPATAPAHVSGADPSVFMDRKDSITVFGKGAGERIFVAFGDHGFARFGEAIPADAPPPAVPLAAPSSPVPLPLAGMNPAVIGAVAGALSVSLLFRMLASKKKVAAEAPSL